MRFSPSALRKLIELRASDPHLASELQAWLDRLLLHADDPELSVYPFLDVNAYLILVTNPATDTRWAIVWAYASSDVPEIVLIDEWKP